jgi:hypothetical protein
VAKTGTHRITAVRFFGGLFGRMYEHTLGENSRRARPAPDEPGREAQHLGNISTTGDHCGRGAPGGPSRNEQCAAETVADVAGSGPATFRVGCVREREIIRRTATENLHERTGERPPTTLSRPSRVPLAGSVSLLKKPDGPPLPAAAVQIRPKKAASGRLSTTS